uniref:Uncharacterized protein n=1 Tax=Anguilla anguilla TaxID=7936 RepID=A0A0E9Q5T8_ANGAN
MPHPAKALGFDVVTLPKYGIES